MAELTGRDARHLIRVLRAQPGQKYEISDNHRPYLAEIFHSAKDRVVFRVLEALPPRPPAVTVRLYAALIKFDHFEWMLEKATELGVTEIVPVDAERSDKGLREAAGRRFERWMRIVRESSQQSRRDQMPELRLPADLPACLREAASYRYYLEEEPGAVSLAAALPEPGRRKASDQVSLLTGPEGGWTSRERLLAVAAGWRAVSLGPQVLRAETAVLAAQSVLACAWWASEAG
jgi:16S rRNA (uracil1498-N3)-methyltransferase